MEQIGIRQQNAGVKRKTQKPIVLCWVFAGDRKTTWTRIISDSSNNLVAFAEVKDVTQAQK